MENISEIESVSLLLESVYQREMQEKLASALITSETLARLNLSTEGLPQKCQALLRETSKHSTETQPLDTIVHILRHSMNQSEELENDYEILKLEQKNQELQRRIDRNKLVIGSLSRDLEEAKQGLFSGSVNPKNVHDLIRQLRQKVVAYEESFEKAKMKFSKLSVPEFLHPRSLEELVTSLAALKVEEAQLKEKADDVILERKLRDKLRSFKR